VHQGVQIASKVQAAAGSTKMVDFRAQARRWSDARVKISQNTNHD
jgi:hypothetical protein